jgi:hypothetical protein
MSGFFDGISSFFSGNSGVSAFRSRMEMFARQLGLDFYMDDDGQPVCAFGVNWDDEHYTFIVAQTGNEVRLAANSRIKFAPGCLPDQVIAFLIQQNAKLKHCDYDTIENRKHSYFMVKSVVKWHRLTVALMKDAISELVARIVALDKTMIQEGYA